MAAAESRPHVLVPMAPPKGTLLKNYPLNSPEAAGRIVALVLMSDGHVCRSERVSRRAPFPAWCRTSAKT